MKKGYNPFKMWGSYVGAGVLVLPIFLIAGSQIAGMILGCPERDMGLFFASMCRVDVEGTLAYVQFTLGSILSLIPGFLVGWGVHSLCRWFKNAF